MFIHCLNSRSWMVKLVHWTLEEGHSCMLVKFPREFYFHRILLSWTEIKFEITILIFISLILLNDNMISFFSKSDSTMRGLIHPFILLRISASPSIAMWEIEKTDMFHHEPEYNTLIFSRLWQLKHWWSIHVGITLFGE